MSYIIFENGKEINRIVASPAFVDAYCEAHGYTYEEIPAPVTPEPEEPETETTDAEMAAAILEGVNAV